MKDCADQQCCLWQMHLRAFSNVNVSCLLPVCSVLSCGQHGARPSFELPSTNSAGDARDVCLHTEGGQVGVPLRYRLITIP